MVDAGPWQCFGWSNIPQHRIDSEELFVGRQVGGYALRSLDSRRILFLDDRYRA